MKKFIVILIISSLANFAQAQTVGTIRGKLIDSTNKQSLKDATITVLDARDSTLEVFGLAAADSASAAAAALAPAGRPQQRICAAYLSPASTTPLPHLLPSLLQSSTKIGRAHV